MRHTPARSFTAPTLVERDYQIEAVQALFDYFEKNTGNPLVVMPTGTGKSLVIASFARHVLHYWPTQRLLVLTHVKELIAQNHAKLLQLWPGAPAGIYSAGLSRRDLDMPIIFGGIKSVMHCTEKFGHIDLLIIDECHLISPKQQTVYRQVIAELAQINPWLKIIGLTATPFRLGQGLLTQDLPDNVGSRLFTDTAIDLSTVECWDRFIACGHLVSAIPRQTTTTIDASGVRLNADGDYRIGDLAAASNKREITIAAVDEMCQYRHTRGTWLTFCADIQHADDVATAMRERGISAASVHTKMEGSRDDAFRAWMAGELQSITNYNVATTGLDCPRLDLIGMLRATTSASLWVQMIGRGTRPCQATGKKNCLVLDFASNAYNLGPINAPMLPRPKGKGNGEVPIKLCKCGAYNHLSARICAECGAPFEMRVKFAHTSGTTKIMAQGIDLPIVEEFSVARCTYSLHNRARDGKESLKVDYYTTKNKTFTEWHDFNPGAALFVKHNTNTWWRQRFNEAQTPIPADNQTALRILWSTTGSARVPVRIRVHVNAGKYPRIINATF